jgi:hypothetical protein
MRPLKLKQLVASPRQVMQMAQSPAHSVASATLHESGSRGIRGIHDLDREAAAIIANDLEPRLKPVFCVCHVNTR